MKTCTKCNETKPLDDFDRRLKSSETRRSACRACAEAQRLERMWRPTNHGDCAECGAPIPLAKPGARGGKPRSKFCSRACGVAANRRDGAANSRRYTLARYGITPADYDAMLESQAGRCAICQTDDPASRSGSWHVDHCHDTGVVRGLLCTRCNIGLGQFRDDAARLRAAIDYLNAYHATAVA